MKVLLPKPLVKPNQVTFPSLLVAAQERQHTTLAIGIAPTLGKLPLPIQRFDDPFLPFGKAIIEATSDVVCAYVFHLAAYLALGAAGAVALERTMAYVPAHIVKILHGPFASPDYVDTAIAFGADAVTLAPTTIPADVIPYVIEAKHGVFIAALSGFDPLPILKLNEDHPGQIGVYKPVDEHHNTLGILFEPYSEINWYWGDPIYTSQQDDFREALHTAAAFHQKPRP